MHVQQNVQFRGSRPLTPSLEREVTRGLDLGDVLDSACLGWTFDIEITSFSIGEY